MPWRSQLPFLGFSNFIIGGRFDALLMFIKALLVESFGFGGKVFFPENLGG